MSPPHQSQGREVEDDELFGPSYISTQTKRKTNSLSSNKSNLKRPRSNHNNNTFTQVIQRPLGKATPSWTILNKLRYGHQPPPTNYLDTIEPFVNRPKLGLIQGVPRLSTLALLSARFWASKGRFEDFSLIPDLYMYDLLSTTSISPTQLCHLERLNPKRVCVFEALWATHTMNTFDCHNLPKGVKWWRELYHRKTDEKNERFEQARARLRMSYQTEHIEKKAKHVETTVSLRVPETERKRRRNNTSRDSRSPSLLQKLRLEVRRDKRRR